MKQRFYCNGKGGIAAVAVIPGFLWKSTHPVGTAVWTHRFVFPPNFLYKFQACLPIGEKLVNFRNYPLFHGTDPTIKWDKNQYYSTRVL